MLAPVRRAEPGDATSANREAILNRWMGETLSAMGRAPEAVRALQVAQARFADLVARDASNRVWSNEALVTRLLALEVSPPPRDILREAPGCMVIDKRENGGYITPVECVGDFATFISRIREDPTVDNGLVLWCVSDNLRKGAALNAIQIAEVLINRKLITPKPKAA